MDLVAYKSALRSMESYFKGIAKNEKGKTKEYRSTIVEAFAEDISKYLKKDGTIKKSALRTKKSQAEFNKLVTEFKKSGHMSRAERQANIKRDIKEKRAKSLVNNGYMDSEDKAHKLQDILEDDAIQYLIDKEYLSYYEIRDMVDDSEISDEYLDSFVELAQHIKETKLYETPKEALEDLDFDDLFMSMKNILDRGILSFEDFVNKYEDKHLIKLNTDESKELYSKYVNGEIEP